MVRRVLTLDLISKKTMHLSVSDLSIHSTDTLKDYSAELNSTL